MTTPWAIVYDSWGASQAESRRVIAANVDCLRIVIPLTVPLEKNLSTFASATVFSV